MWPNLVQGKYDSDFDESDGNEKGGEVYRFKIFIDSLF